MVLFFSASSTSSGMVWSSAVHQGSWESIIAKPRVAHSLESGKRSKQPIVTPCGKCDRKQATEYQATARKATTAAWTFKSELMAAGCEGCGDQPVQGEVMSNMAPMSPEEPAESKSLLTSEQDWESM